MVYGIGQQIAIQSPCSTQLAHHHSSQRVIVHFAAVVQ